MQKNINIYIYIYIADASADASPPRFLENDASALPLRASASLPLRATLSKTVLLEVRLCFLTGQGVRSTCFLIVTDKSQTL